MIVLIMINLTLSMILKRLPTCPQRNFSKIKISIHDFRAIRTEINNMRIHISPGLRTAWFACILNNYNEHQGKPANWENVRWTGVLEKIDSQWKIFQMHFSKAEDLVK